MIIMKKFWLILTAIVLACSPALQVQAETAPHQKASLNTPVKGKGKAKHRAHSKKHKSAKGKHRAHKQK